MPLDFSSESSSIEVPTQFQTGFSDVGGAATGVNVNVAGKIGKKAIVQPRVLLTSTDYGSIASAFDYGEAALDLGRSAISDSLDFGDATVQRFADFGDTALHTYGDISSDALARVSGGVRDSLDFAAGLFGEALGAQRQLTDANLGGLQSLAMQTSASSDDRVQKVAMYALLAVAAVMILPRIFGKGA